MPQTNQTAKIEALVRDLPDAESARRFFSQLAEKYSSESNRLLRTNNQGLLADVLALAAWSPFLATTLLQHPEYFAWLGRQRSHSKVRDKDELLESLARFSLTNSQLEPHVLLARFRRRELLRVFLQDIRNLSTIAEITEELSNLADACLENALRLARQEMDNRFGVPLETDEKGRTRTAQFCVVGLGKLGSRELNYASDIDLVFLYSNDGTTSGTGARGAVTNREYFVKLAETVTRIVGAQSNEGAAYRVDLRLRPHGRVGGLAISLKEIIGYYQNSARDWERQVLLRARSSAGDAAVFKRFAEAVEPFVFQPDVSVADALESVRLSKQKINQEQKRERGFNVKLGRGGIREIEFIAQALQLAYGGRDAWLRAPHTLISLNRLADRRFLSENQLTALADAYAFLRRLEHRLQMEHGLQTHAVPDEMEKRTLVARRMNFAGAAEFETILDFHTNNVSQIFERVFGQTNEILKPVKKEIEETTPEVNETKAEPNEKSKDERSTAISKILASLEKSTNEIDLSVEKLNALTKVCEISPYFCEMLTANPALINALPEKNAKFANRDYAAILRETVENKNSFSEQLAALRIEWTRYFVEIAGFDAFEQISLKESSRLQTTLAEASLQAALIIAAHEIKRRFGEFQNEFRIAVLGLGKLGSSGMDYGSDLDVVLIYDDENGAPISNLTQGEFYCRTSEILVTALSSLTREGYLYRVDLRLRPDGKNGATCSGACGFFDYLETRSAIWEWLAYVKLRASAGNLEFARKVETKARQIVHKRAEQTEASELKAETKRVRERLEAEKSKNARRGEIDIKYGTGGLLDVYFAVRYLQLKDNIPDKDENRSTAFTLEKLREAGSLDKENFAALFEGYNFLREVDHALRLTIGRSTRIPATSHPLLSQISARMKYASENELLQNLAFYTANIRTAYENLLS